MKLYGALDLAFAALYAWFGFVFTPGRSSAFNLALGLVCALLAAAGAGLLVGARWGRTLAIAACGLLLAFSAVVIVLLVASSAYLRGIYGALGQGMAIMSLLVAALIVEAFALLPLFQLRFMLGRARA
ncbi:MAG: hypothetical protein JWN44_998 [Myxococcales bacterium]|nr:hypothetical protein [Myxococcales bacterium]